MKKAIYAGSFDPVTLGHMDIIERAANLFDCLVVAVLENPNKKSLFTVEERKHHLELATKHIENVEVASFQGLLVDFAKEIGANIAVRGLRNTLDFSAEYPMFLINRKLYDKIETVYLSYPVTWILTSLVYIVFFIWVRVRTCRKSAAA